jgi:hypothetical protein
LARPLVTAAELVGLAVAAPLLWAIGPLTRFVLVLTVELLVWSLVRNLPQQALTAQAGRTSSWLRDGEVARLAFAHPRAGTPPRAAATPVH